VLRFYIVLVNVAIFPVPFACAFLKLILYDMDFLFEIVLIYAELSISFQSPGGTLFYNL